MFIVIHNFNIYTVRLQINNNNIIDYNRLLIDTGVYIVWIS